MTDLKARKEEWLWKADELIHCHVCESTQEPEWEGNAARLIRLYEAEREARKAVDKVRSEWRSDDLFLSAEFQAWALADAALNSAWAEILGGEDGE